MNEKLSAATVKRILVGLVLAFVVPVTVVALIVKLVVVSTNPLRADDPAMAADEVAKRLRPVGEVTIADAMAPKIVKSGEDVVKGVCAACHMAGLLNAPKIGDKGEWGKRAAQGLEQLVQHAISGKNSMPPRGGNPDLSDLEIARAIVYMADQGGAKFDAPDSWPPAGKASKLPAKKAQSK